MPSRREIVTAIVLCALSPAKALASWIGKLGKEPAGRCFTGALAPEGLGEPRWDRLLRWIPVRFTANQSAAYNRALSGFVWKFNSTPLRCHIPLIGAVETVAPDTHLCVDYRVQFDDKAGEFFGSLRFQHEPRGPWRCFQGADGLLCQKRIYESIDIAGELARVGSMPLS